MVVTQQAPAVSGVLSAQLLFAKKCLCFKNVRTEKFKRSISLNKYCREKRHTIVTKYVKID